MLVPCPDAGHCGSQTHNPFSQQMRECKRNAQKRRLGQLKDEPVQASAVLSAPAPVRRDDGDRFSAEEFVVGGRAFHGRAPRQIQVEPLNGLMSVLDADGKGQMIAACGTGKSYMSQQLLREYTTGEDAHGIGVILTSSIHLAEQTADGLRSDSNAFGTPGEEFMVIEVHSRRRKAGDPGRGDQVLNPKTNVIDEDAIAKKIVDAKSRGIPVVIVSTYDSADKVTSGQRLAAASLDDESVRADIMIADEAHNILGPRIQSSEKAALDEDDSEVFDVASERFGSFVDEDGGIQSDRRAFLTATPVTRTVDTNMDGVLRDESAVYSNEFETVGRVGGVISIEDAVDSGALVGAQYVVNGVSVNARLQDFIDPVVSPDGTVVERGFDLGLPDPDTYAAICSSLDEMVADEQSRNVLMFVPSREEADAIVSSMRKVALDRSKGMSSVEAQDNVESDDPSMRRRARMRLLADHMDVRTAHFQTPSAERKAALDMFKDKETVESRSWTPRVKVLANINILSEGVDVPEIDTVVLADRSKTNERSMTQAVGRAMRTLPSDYAVNKQRGKVVIPSLSDGDGEVNPGFVARAVTGADMVQKAVTAKNLSGASISRGSTSVRLQEGDTRLASDIVTDMLPRPKDLASYLVASKITLTHQWLASQGLSTAARQRMEAVKPGLYDRAMSDESRLTRVERGMVLHAVALAKHDLGVDADDPSLSEYISSGAGPRDMQNCVDRMAVLEAVLDSGQVDLLPDDMCSTLVHCKILIQSLKPMDALSPEARAKAETNRKVCTSKIFNIVKKSDAIRFGDPESERMIVKAIGRDRFNEIKRTVSVTSTVDSARQIGLVRALENEFVRSGDVESVSTLARLMVEAHLSDPESRKRRAAVNRTIRDLSESNLRLAQSDPLNCDLVLSEKVLSRSKKGGLKSNAIAKALMA